MTVNLTSVFNFVKKYLLSKKGIAVSVCIGAALFAYSMITNRVIPMAYSSEGAQPLDLATTGLSIITAVISFIASNYLGVKPEVIQAVIAFEKDKTNPENQGRLCAAILGYIIGMLKSNQNVGGFVLNLLSSLITAIDDPNIKLALSNAAKDVAIKQFSPVVENVGVK